MSRNTSSSSSSISSTCVGNGPCGACKLLRRKCVRDCIFAPYFDSEHGMAHFAAVHKVFGASNVSKLLLRIPTHKRFDAVITICYEAHARIRDPVYGCVAHVFALQQQVVDLQVELEHVQTHLASFELSTQPNCLASLLAPSSSAPTTSFSATIEPQQLQQVTGIANDQCSRESQSIDDNLQAVAQELLSICFPGVRFPQSKSC